MDRKRYLSRLVDKRLDLYLSTFGAVCVDKVKLLKKNNKGIYKPIKAKVLELEQFNKKDEKIIKNIGKLWDGTQYGESILHEFFSKKINTNRFFAIQTKNGFKKQITNLMEIDTPFDGAVKNFKLCIKFLQSAPNIANKKAPKIKGSGEVPWLINKSNKYSNNYHKINYCLLNKTGKGN